MPTSLQALCAAFLAALGLAATLPDEDRARAEAAALVAYAARTGQPALPAHNPGSEPAPDAVEEPVETPAAGATSSCPGGVCGPARGAYVAPRFRFFRRW